MICHSDRNKGILPSLDSYEDFDTDKYKIFVLSLGRNTTYIEHDGRKGNTGDGVVLILSKKDVEKCTNSGNTAVGFNLTSVFRMLDSDNYAVCSQSKITVVNKNISTAVAEELFGSGNSLVDIYVTMMELDLAAIPYVTIDLSINRRHGDSTRQ